MNLIDLKDSRSRTRQHCFLFRLQQPDHQHQPPEDAPGPPEHRQLGAGGEDQDPAAGGENHEQVEKEEL